MTILVAITGGIGSGKSTFSKEVIKNGFKLLDSDEQVLNIYKKPPKSFLKHLKKINLGLAIKKNKIDRKYIASVIFSNQNTKVKLEKYIFKAIKKIRVDFIKKEKKKKTKLLFFDIPLLFENNLEEDFNIVISILAPKKDRFKRLKRSKNIKKDMFKKILKTQTSDVVRKKNSDIVINNNKNIKTYMSKINRTLKRISL